MKKILIVDDSSFMRTIIKGALKGVNAEIIEATNGDDAMLLFKKHRPNLVTMDIAMPGKSGIDTLKEMVQYDEKAQVIICSSMVNERTGEEVRLAGAKSFITKPFQNGDFKKEICQFL